MTGLPAGLSFSTGTRRVTGSPTTVQTETVTYTVTDNDGDTDSDTFTWEIADPPEPRSCIRDVCGSHERS